VPRANNAMNVRPIEIPNAETVSQITYGNRGMNPETKYEKNITTEAMSGFRIEARAWLAYSSAEYSERKLPAAIENASTKISTIPVRKIVPRGTPAIATPESRPTEETKLSSTPNTKFRK